jgi:hypothetical protein
MRNVALSIVVMMVCAGGSLDAKPIDRPPQHNMAMTDASGPAAALVRSLVEKRPRRLSELEAIVGPIAMSFEMKDHENMGSLRRPRGGSGDFTALVPRLDVRYAFDIHHQEPTRKRDVGLEDYTLEVRGDAAVAQQILTEKLGAPRTVSDGATSYSAHHPFYLAQSAPDRFRIAFHAAVPRFAIPVPDANARAAWLASLARRIASAQSVDEIDAFCKVAPKDAGIEIVGTLNRSANPYGLPAKDPRDYWIKLVPPVRADVIATAFGWGQIVGVSHDVHMSSWHVEQRTGTWLPISGAAEQWQIKASFAKLPTGGSSTRRSAREVGTNDEIDSLAIAPRFK